MLRYLDGVVNGLAENMHLLSVAFHHILPGNLIEDCALHKHCQQNIHLPEIRIERLLHLADNLNRVVQSCRIQKMCLCRNDYTI